MIESQLIELMRESLKLAVILAGPPLVAALVVAVLVGALQTVTQMHEAVVSQLTRMAAIAVVVFLVLPWMFGSWVEFARGMWLSMAGN